jgi:hypothetical protein
VKGEWLPIARCLLPVAIAHSRLTFDASRLLPGELQGHHQEIEFPFALVYPICEIAMQRHFQQSFTA